MKMVNKASNEQRSPSNMTISTREVLRPTICSVSMRHLAVMPEFFREFMSERDIFRRLNQKQLNRKNSSTSSSNSRRIFKSPKGTVTYLAVKRTNRSEVNYNPKEPTQLSDNKNIHSHQGRNPYIFLPRAS